MQLPVSGNELIALIPQKPPFVLISSLNEVNDKTCITTFKFDANHILCDNGKLTAAGLLENIAQSSGCKLGYEDFRKGRTHKVGFIGEVRDFVVTHLPDAGCELSTEITIEGQVFGAVTIATGKVMMDYKEIASCRMKIFFAPEPEEAAQ